MSDAGARGHRWSAGSRLELTDLDVGAEIGRGAATVVFRAQRHGRPYALKQLRGAAGHEPEALASFRREAALMACVDHPGLRRTRAVGLLDGRPALVADLIDGAPLSDLLTGGMLDQARVVTLGAEIAQALAAAHQAGLVHRDLKPHNVMVPRSGPAVLIDFGLAARAGKAVAEDSAVGTFIYSSPEQTGMLKRPVDGRSDLYSLGAVLFECLTGHPPYQSPDVGALLRQHAAAPIPDVRETRPDVDPALAEIVTRLLAKDPDDRFGSATELLTALRRCSDAVAPGAPMIWPLYGRDAELSALTSRWARARAGAGGVAVVHGPAGFGKTRLLEAVTAAADGALVLDVRCGPDDTVPLAALREALDRRIQRWRALPEDEWVATAQTVRESALAAGASLLKPLSAGLADLLADVPDIVAEGRDEQFVHAVATFLIELSTRLGPVLLRIDDAHWLDDSGRRVLAHLDRKLAGAPLLVLITAAHDADTAPGEFAAGADPVLALGALSDDDMAALVASRLPGAPVPGELAAHVTARSGGVPLSAIEYLRRLVDGGLLVPHWDTWLLDEEGLDALPIPADGLDLVVSRLDELTDAERAVLAVAAAVGGRFDLDLTSAGGHCAEDVATAVEAATARRLVEARAGGRYGFVNPAVRQALLATLDPHDRRRLHARIARRLETLDPAAREADHVYAVAGHYAQADPAGEAESVYRTSVAAGRQALADQAPAEAVTFLEQAVQAADAHGLPVAIDTHHLLATAYLRAGRLTQARERLDLALARSDDPWQRAALWTTLAELHNVAYADEEAAKAVMAGLAEIGRPLPGNKLARVLSGFVPAFGAAVVRRTGAGFGTVRGRRREEYLIRARLLDTGAYAAALGMRLDEVAAFAQRALFVANRLGPGAPLARAYAMVGFIAVMVRLRGVGLRCFARAARYAADLADPALVAYVDFTRTVGLLFSGSGDSGREWDEILDRHARWLEPAQFIAGMGTLGMRQVLRGNPREAQACYERGIAVLPAGREISGTSLAALSVMIPAQQGHLGEAAAALADLQGSFDHDTAGIQQRRTLALAAMHSLVEQGEFGELFEAAVADFERIAAGGGLMTHHNWCYTYVAYGRLTQCRLAPEPDAGLLAAAHAAVRELGRHTATPLLGVAHALTRAALLLLEGKYSAVLRLVDRIERKARPLDSPLVAFEIARLRARALRRTGITGEADRQAQWAHMIATRYGLESRARQVRAEFDITDATSAAPVTRMGERVTRTVVNRRMEALQQVSIAAASVLDPDRLARIALDETLRILGAERALMFLVDDGGRVRPFVGRDAVGGDLDAVSDYGSSLVQRVADTGEALVVTGTEHGASLGSESVVVHGLRSIMVAPVQFKGRLIGIVYLDSRMARGIFTEDDVEVLTAITSHVAVSLETARAAQLDLAVRTARRQQELAETLRASLAELTTILDPAQLLHHLFTTLHTQLGAATAALLRGGDSLTVTHLAGPAPGAVGRQVDPGTDRAWAALGAVESVTVLRAGQAPPVVAELLGDHPTTLVVPLVNRDGPVGVVLLAGRAFDDTARNVAATLTGQGMTAYHNAQLFTRVQELATTDELTGVHNRRHFFSLATALFGAARRGGHGLSAAMLDIDNFKKINDTYGHGVGDDVIREVAHRIAAALRESDILGRYGGEEFAVVLPDCADIDIAPLERIRSAVAAEPVLTRDGPVTVTISIGLAALNVHDDGLDQLLARADHALYEAKTGGRNKVIAV
ncbi:diguanylate cyclase (GGDEF)-like protein [Krasilnikovia cinnamomea]|uniref:Diguanylate cyclase (GGDEF)-like protein n=1 Tax=Krasilnikovia cinnamomea TaxID=349313 RepID=A0A4Q7ZRP9_9ACTN|nr:diguanylate cyclase [Krasilnikovia cinnamomea]RZU53828.1 diguanylate cyclase (GGDEF)-like protein [Krasilnikovia cinnamomea]